MSLLLNKVDLADWRPLAPSPVATGVGASMAWDRRNDLSCHPLIYNLVPPNGAPGFQAYVPRTDGWITLTPPAGLGAIGVGTGIVFVASAGPSGTLSSGNTTTNVVLSTALLAAVGPNQLANRGDGLRGFKIRIIGNSSGGSGKTEERFITGNTAGTTPTVTLSSALSFTPAAGDRYEILSGRVFFYTGGPLWRAYDIATNAMTGALSVTNLSAAGSQDFVTVVLDEQFVPSTRVPGDGFFGNLLATGSSSTSLTGQAVGGDAAVLTNEFRNFQIRIVTDTATPTAVGQRRRITAHTAGASPVYTVAAWTVTPSSTATYVIEGNNDILLWTSGNGLLTFSYAAGGFAADASWSTASTAGSASQYASRSPGLSQGGTSIAWAHGITLDSAKNARYSYVFAFRGGNTATLDLLDIAGAATGAWTLNVSYGNASSAAGIIMTGSTVSAYDPVGNDGRYLYININAGQDNIRFDVKNRVLEPFSNLRYPVGTAQTGYRMAVLPADEASPGASILYLQRGGSIEWFGIDLTDGT